MMRRPPRSTQGVSSAASDVYKRQVSTQSTWEKKNRLKAKEKKVDTSDQSMSYSSSASDVKSVEKVDQPSRVKRVGKGMRLGKELKPEKVKEKAAPIAKLVEEEKKAPVNPLLEAISITIDEKIVAMISKEGDVGKFEIKGEIYLYVNDETKANTEVHLAINETKGVAIKPHPELNRSLWNSQHVLASKSKSGKFPTNLKLEALKYKYSTSSQSDIPFTLTVWSSEGSITLEIEFNEENPKFTYLENLRILIPVGPKKPQVLKIEESEANFLDKERKLEWLIPRLDSSKSAANMEFKTSADPETLYPFEVTLSYPYSILGAKVSKVIATDSKQAITYTEKMQMSCQSFQVVSDL
eukprot:TRINITY_DN1187_c0_g1_i2.p1 TRINITY_DN1187_c0_g1~~TRINITY_DN1187_c0_g1_i2.p1  ORF type:complete len:354 (+),score=79.75 TRINITY_DN1187_c0_g1_i2:91-1152(+)